MNRITLRFLFFTGLAAIFCASCSKDKDLPDIPDSYNLNDSVPFSVEAVPPEGRDTLIFFRIKNNDSIKTPFNPTDASLEFKTGDSIILETRAKSGYTFINWVRDGNGVSDNPIYGFKLKEKDIDTSNWHIKHHYEARFGLDYAIQSIPSIDEVMPADLIAEMGPYLNFGDNPPQIDSFSIDIIELIHFIHNLDHPEIPFDSTMYSKPDQRPENFWPTPAQFTFYCQHRGVFDSCRYERFYDPFVQGLNIKMIEFANTQDSIFIMGNDPKFTIYYKQSRKRRIEPESESHIVSNINGGLSLIIIESIIISGIKTEQGVQNIHWGSRIEKYTNFEPMNNYNNIVGKRGGLPAIHDMFHYTKYQP